MSRKCYWGLGVLIVLLIGVSVVMLTRITDTEPRRIYKDLSKGHMDNIRKQIKTEIRKQPEQAAEQKLTNNSVPAGEKPSSSELQIGDIVDGRMYLGTEKPSPEFLAELRASLRTQDEITSPYGFGPYPELPEGYGPITWPRESVNSELMIRVRIKLMKQGVPVEGSVMSDGLVYPIIKGVRYVRWGETSDGRQYLRETLGHPDDGEIIKTVSDAKFSTWESVTSADFPEIQIIPMEEGGIDPYTFLDLPK